MPSPTRNHEENPNATDNDRPQFGRVGTEPPVGAITALVGCPIFLVILVGGRGRRAPGAEVLP